MRKMSVPLLTSLFMCMSVIASAGTLHISPTRLTVSPSSEVVAFNLRNAGDQKAVIEVEVFEWTDVNDPKALEPTRDLLIVPPIVEVPANKTQVLRLAPRMPSVLEKERMYRLIVKEIPSSLGQETGIGFAVEMSLPIFMVPEGAEPNPVWALGWRDVATPELTLVNRGEAHLRVRSFGLFDDPNGNPILENRDAAYVLAGEEKAWALNAELAHFKGPLTLKAETTNGLIEALVVFPDH